MRLGRPVVVAGLVAVCAASIAGVYKLRSRETRPPRSVMSHEEQQRRYLFDHVQPVALKNCALERFGEPHDGGYLLCGNLLGGVESAYSYGISGYDGWGCEVTLRTGVPVHQYDCFNLTRPVCSGGRTTFHPECIGAVAEKIEGRTFDSLASQVRKNGDWGKRLVVKMDVEGAEWESLLTAPADVLERIDQLAIEFHGVEEARFVWTVLRLNEHFHVAHLHFNNHSCLADIGPFPARAYEVLLVNKRLGILDPDGTVRLPNPEDAPNTLAMPDCQATR